MCKKNFFNITDDFYRKLKENKRIFEAGKFTSNEDTLLNGVVKELKDRGVTLTDDQYDYVNKNIETYSEDASKLKGEGSWNKKVADLIITDIKKANTKLSNKENSSNTDVSNNLSSENEVGGSVTREVKINKLLSDDKVASFFLTKFLGEPTLSALSKNTNHSPLINSVYRYLTQTNDDIKKIKSFISYVIGFYVNHVYTAASFVSEIKELLDNVSSSLDAAENKRDARTYKMYMREVNQYAEDVKKQLSRTFGISSDDWKPTDIDELEEAIPLTDNLSIFKDQVIRFSNDVISRTNKEKEKNPQKFAIKEMLKSNRISELNEIIKFGNNIKGDFIKILKEKFFENMIFEGRDYIMFRKSNEILFGANAKPTDDFNEIIIDIAKDYNLKYDEIADNKNIKEMKKHFLDNNFMFLTTTQNTMWDIHSLVGRISELMNNFDFIQHYDSFVKNTPGMTLVFSLKSYPVMYITLIPNPLSKR